MKGIIKFAGLGIIAGVSAKAGYWLWDRHLEDKAEQVVQNFKTKKKSKKKGS